MLLMFAIVVYFTAFNGGFDPAWPRFNKPFCLVFTVELPLEETLFSCHKHYLTLLQRITCYLHKQIHEYLNDRMMKMDRHYRKTTLLGPLGQFKFQPVAAKMYRSRMLPNKLFHSGMVLNITYLDKVFLLHLGLFNL